MSGPLRHATTILILLLLLFGTGPARAAESTEQARSFVSASVEEFLAILRDKTLTPEQRLDRVEALALQRFDVDRMTKLVLGKNRRSLTETQQTEFRDEFKQHIILTYGHSLESYSNERVDVSEAREEANGDVTVKTTIVGGSTNGVVVVYRVHQEEGSWRVIDVIIEGVSTVQNFRAQVQDIVSTKGVEQLIAILREKNQRTAAANANGATAE